MKNILLLLAVAAMAVSCKKSVTEPDGGLMTPAVVYTDIDGKQAKGDRVDISIYKQTGGIWQKGERVYDHVTGKDAPPFKTYKDRDNTLKDGYGMGFPLPNGKYLILIKCKEKNAYACRAFTIKGKAFSMKVDFNNAAGKGKFYQSHWVF